MKKVCRYCDYDKIFIRSRFIMKGKQKVDFERVFKCLNCNAVIFGNIKQIFPNPILNETL